MPHQRFQRFDYSKVQRDSFHSQCLTRLRSSGSCRYIGGNGENERKTTAKEVYVQLQQSPYSPSILIDILRLVHQIFFYI